MTEIHLVKLSIGTESVADLIAWQKRPAVQTVDGLPRHITRMWPKRAAELIRGGSIYWVIKGEILARQRIIRLDEITGEDGIRRCAIVLDPEMQRTRPATRAPFQGWRYLSAADAPPDLRPLESDGALPEQLDRALSEIGVI